MKGYRIKTVSRMTGMSPELLRAWERRHGVVSPRRTPGGYREYSEEDVERLRLLALLTSRGYSIGEIAGLGLDELSELISSGTPSAPTAHAPAAAPGNLVVQQLRERAEAGDGEGFRRALRRILVLLPTRQVIGDVLLTVLRELSARGEGEDARAARLLAGEEIRGFLGPLAGEAPSRAPLALIAVSDPGAGRDALQVTLATLERGWRTVGLGPLVSPAQLAARARAATARVAILVCPSRPSATTLLALVEAWGDAGPDGCALILVGADRGLLAEAAREHGVQVVRDDVDLAAALRSLESTAGGSG